MTISLCLPFLLKPIISLLKSSSGKFDFMNSLTRSSPDCLSSGCKKSPSKDGFFISVRQPALLVLDGLHLVLFTAVVGRRRHARLERPGRVDLLFIIIVVIIVVKSVIKVWIFETKITAFCHYMFFNLIFQLENIFCLFYTMSVPDNLRPTHSEKTTKAMKAPRAVKRITFNPSEANPGETLNVHVPKLNENEVLVPGSLALRFDIDLSGGHANIVLVQNVSRALVDKLVLKFEGTTLQDTVTTSTKYSKTCSCGGKAGQYGA